MSRTVGFDHCSDGWFNHLHPLKECRASIYFVENSQKKINNFILKKIFKKKGAIR